MTRVDQEVLDRFFDVLVEEIGRGRPEYLRQPFTVAEIYQELVPYRTHRDAIGVKMNGDYEDALLHLLAGYGNYLLLESEPVRRRIREEVEAKSPNTGIYREYAAVELRLNKAFIPPHLVESSNGEEGPEAERAGGSGGASVPGRREAGPASGSGSESVEPSSLREPHSPVPPPAAPGSNAKAGEASAPKEDSALSPVSGGTGAEPPPGAGGTVSRCPDCSQDLPDRDALRFCPFCGNNVFTVDCRECGEELDREWSFCLACGTAVGG